MTVVLGGNANPYKRLTNAGWNSLSPNTHERTIMKQKCGSRCFLGPKNEKCFPICAKGTCKIKAKGVMAAYMRARQQAVITRKRTSKSKKSGHHHHSKKEYKRIAARAKKILTRKGYKVGK